ncbi:hypothetical protein C8R42DRAFT_718751 [Lentinula raphanica]|nr:hypothetical protein C8R42DRAFT_718751 [Lentinula raphanica]
MTRYAPRTLAILFLGAAVFSSVLAAPTSQLPPAMSDSPISTGAQPLHPRSVGQTSEVATIQRRKVKHADYLPLRDDGSGLIDDEYNPDGKDGWDVPDNISVSVNLDRRAGADYAEDEAIQHAQNVLKMWKDKSVAEVVAQIKEDRERLQSWSDKFGPPGHELTDQERLQIVYDLAQKELFTMCDNVLGTCSQRSRIEKEDEVQAKLNSQKLEIWLRWLENVVGPGAADTATLANLRIYLMEMKKVWKQ